jgi:hypothetical protein
MEARHILATAVARYDELRGRELVASMAAQMSGTDTGTRARRIDQQVGQNGRIGYTGMGEYETADARGWQEAPMSPAHEPARRGWPPPTWPATRPWWL